MNKNLQRRGDSFQCRRSRLSDYANSFGLNAKLLCQESSPNQTIIFEGLDAVGS